MRHLQGPAADSFRFEPGGNSIHRFGGSGKHHALRPVDNSDAHFLFETGDLRPHPLHWCADGAHGSRCRQRVHQPRPRAYQPQSVFHAEHAGHHRCHIFAQAVAQQHARLNAPATPQFRQRVLEGKQCRLRISALHPSGSASPSAGYNTSDQRLARFLFPCRRAPLDRFPKHRRALIQLPPHPRILASLPGKQKSHPPALAAFSNPGKHAGGNFFRLNALQLRRHLRRVFRH